MKVLYFLCHTLKRRSLSPWHGKSGGHRCVARELMVVVDDLFTVFPQIQDIVSLDHAVDPGGRDITRNIGWRSCG